MTFPKKALSIALILLLLSGVGTLAYFANQNFQAREALEENVEYQVVNAIETAYPVLYVVAVQNVEGHILAYIIMPDAEFDGSMVVDIVTILYNAYPGAQTYHILSTNIVEAEVFEGAAHIGVADEGYGFSHLAAHTLAEGGDETDLVPLHDDNQWGIYSPSRMNNELVTTPTAREPEHIPPWADVED